MALKHTITVEGSNDGIMSLADIEAFCLEARGANQAEGDGVIRARVAISGALKSLTWQVTK